MTDPITTKVQSFLHDHLLRQWMSNGFDVNSRLSFESLQLNWEPSATEQIRLLSQCRQLFTFSYAYKIFANKDFLDLLSPLFEAICEHYFIDERWHFSLTDQLKPKDSKTDTYTLAFIFLAFSHYYSVTKDVRAKQHIEKAHAFLLNELSSGDGAFYESYPINLSETRRQNPHMHLLEGYLAVYSELGDKRYLDMINRLSELALEKFYHADSKTLREFFSNDWELDTERGHIVEPGHLFEWVWLLNKTYRVTQNTRLIELANNLWQTGTEAGISKSGGVVNQLNGDTKAVIDPCKRIWPITEYMKAITVAPLESSEKSRLLHHTIGFMETYYFREDGGWNEYLDEGNTPLPGAKLPATTSYHIFLGLTEAIQHLDSQSKSTNQIQEAQDQ